MPPRTRTPRKSPPDENATPPPSSSSSSKQKAPTPGSLVAFTSGPDDARTTRYGLVVAGADTHPDGSKRLDDDGKASPGARVAWLDAVSDPIDLAELETI